MRVEGHGERTAGSGIAVVVRDEGEADREGKGQDEAARERPETRPGRDSGHLSCLCGLYVQGLWRLR